MVIKMQNRLNKLHPLTIFLYLSGVMILTMIHFHPVYVGASFFLALSAGLMMQGKEILKAVPGILVPVLFFSAFILPLFSHNGVTPLFYINNQAVTAENIRYGVVMSFFLVAIYLWFRVAGILLDEEKILYLFGKIFPRIGLLIMMVFRTLPLMKLRYREISEGQKGLGMEEEKGILKRFRCESRKISTLVAWTLENSIETSVSMECRGYGTGRRTSFHLFHLHGEDIVIDIVLAVLFVSAGVCWQLAEISIYYFPAFYMSDTKGCGIAGIILFAVAALIIPLWGIVTEKKGKR